MNNDIAVINIESKIEESQSDASRLIDQAKKLAAAIVDVPSCERAA